MITVAGLRESANMYAAGDLRHPHASPVHGAYTGLPPLLLQVGTREILLDDSTRVAAKAKSAGVNVRLEVEDGAYHVWHAMPHLPESIDALSRIGAFVTTHIRI